MRSYRTHTLNLLVGFSTLLTVGSVNAASQPLLAAFPPQKNQSESSLAFTANNPVSPNKSQSVSCDVYMDPGPISRATAYGEVEVINGVYQGVAQQYSLNGQLTGVVFKARVNPASASTNTVKVVVYNANQGLPGTIIATQNIVLNAAAVCSTVTVMFTSPLTINGNVIISVEPLSQFTDDYFVQRNVSPNGGNLNLIKVKQSNQWFKNLAAGDPAFDYDFMILPITVQNVSASFTSIVSMNNVNFTNTSSNAGAYFWTFGDGGTSTSVNPQYTYAAIGTYTAQVVAFANGPTSCADSTSSQIIITVTGLNETSPVSIVTLKGSNQVQNVLTIQSNENIPISIYSLEGALCGTYQLLAGEVNSIDISYLGIGSYLIQGSFKSIRFVKTL